MYVATKIAEVQEVGKRGGDDSLGGVDLLLGDGAKHCLKFSDEVQRGKGPGAELMFGVDFVESHTTEASGADSSVQIRCNPLL